MGRETLTTENLRDNEIRYFKKVTTTMFDLNPQALLVTEGLLDFDQILPEECFRQLDANSKTTVREDFPESRIPSPTKSENMSRKRLRMYNEKHQISRQIARFDLAQEISLQANNIVAAKETRWSGLVKQQLFNKMIQLARSAEGAKYSRAQITVERIQVEDEDTWTHGKRVLAATTRKDAPKLSAPKPDLYIALPIMRDSRQRGFQQDNYIKNFTLQTLANLEKNIGLDPCPVVSLAKRSSLDEKHLVCFPCAVVEIKHHRVGRAQKEKCYCQGANAAATGLALLNKLSRYSIHPGDHEDIRPIICFTFIGHKARVWMTYISSKCSEPGNNQELCVYCMQCIWKGDLRCPWDTLQLCCIIENLQFWCLKHFRPWVSSCLDRWNYLYIGAIRKAKTVKKPEEPIQASSEEDENESNESEAAETTDEGLSGIERKSSGSTSPDSDQDYEDDENQDLYSNRSTESFHPVASGMEMGYKKKYAQNIDPGPSRYDSESSATDTEKSPLPRQKRENEVKSALGGLRREAPEPKQKPINLVVRSFPVNKGRIRARSMGP